MQGRESYRARLAAGQRHSLRALQSLFGGAVLVRLGEGLLGLRAGAGLGLSRLGLGAAGRSVTGITGVRRYGKGA